MDQVPIGSPRQTEQVMLSLITAQGGSNMTVKAFCALHNVAEARYYYWRKKYLAKKEPPIARNESFALLDIKAAEGATLPGLFAEVNGIKLYREVPPGYLKSLL